MTARLCAIWKPLADARGSDQRWYEKAGLPTGCVKLPIDALDQVPKGDRL